MDRRKEVSSYTERQVVSVDIKAARTRDIGPLAKYASEVLDKYSASRYWLTRFSQICGPESGSSAGIGGCSLGISCVSSDKVPVLGCSLSTDSVGTDWTFEGRNIDTRRRFGGRLSDSGIPLPSNAAWRHPPWAF